MKLRKYAFNVVVTIFVAPIFLTPTFADEKEAKVEDSLVAKRDKLVQSLGEEDAKLVEAIRLNNQILVRDLYTKLRAHSDRSQVVLSKVSSENAAETQTEVKKAVATIRSDMSRILKVLSKQILDNLQKQKNSDK